MTFHLMTITKVQSVLRGWLCRRDDHGPNAREKQEQRLANLLNHPKTLGLKHKPISSEEEVRFRLEDSAIKWLLRYARCCNWNPHLMANVEDYQRRRAAALFQLLSVYNVPTEVFVSHCKGIDVMGINFRDSVQSTRWNGANMQDIVGCMVGPV